MNNKVQKITSHSPEVKEAAAESFPLRDSENGIPYQAAKSDSESSPTRTIEFDVETENTEESKQTIQGDVHQEVKIPNYREIIFSSVVPGTRVREGVQISQINMCDRKNIFQIIDPVEESSRDKIRKVTGIAMHSYTQKKIVRNPDPNRFEVEKQFHYRDFIFGNIDLYDKEFGVAIELKTKFLENPKWKVKPFVSHVQQLKDLMAMGNISYGALVYEVIGGDEPLIQFNYEMDSDERKKHLTMLEERATTFLNAKNKKDPALARHVFFNKELRWLCDRIDKRTGEHVWCPYYWKCMSMISKERMSDELYSPEINLIARNVFDNRAKQSGIADTSIEL
ncbi:MAG TPA: hypothetical protein VKA95_14340 [Nitrososphaeraceae archaeon]|nr:hypothetical protein [Nitrososphaeraceae archaeon]